MQSIYEPPDDRKRFYVSAGSWRASVVAAAEHPIASTPVNYAAAEYSRERVVCLAASIGFNCRWPIDRPRNDPLRDNIPCVSCVCVYAQVSIEGEYSGNSA